MSREQAEAAAEREEERSGEEAVQEETMGRS